MKNKVYICLLILISVLCSCNSTIKGEIMQAKEPLNIIPETLEIGFLEMETRYYSVPIYRTPNDPLPYDILRFKVRGQWRDPKHWKVVFRTENKITVKPFSMEWNNGPTIKLRVIEIVDETTYRVVLNEETLETCFINIEEYKKYNKEKMDAANIYNFIYKYESWSDYLQRVYYISKPNLIIYDKPNGEIIHEDKEGYFLPFRVAEVDGNWIKLIKHHTYRNRYNPEINYDGWTQWRDGERILIIMDEFPPII